ncbi:glycosyltransferase [Virgibacillus sp. W0430]|uniref:glycosyltransferase n=1 Tax=Virgibacillus sp. W0430 TaxID=3391580 RepID=UPI003F46497B
MRKKVIFMLIDMNVGGTEKSLLNLVDNMPRDQYEITFLLLQRRGGFLKSIPDDVEVLYFKDFKKISPWLNYHPKKRVVELIKNKSILKAFYVFFLHIVLRITKDRRIFFRNILRGYPAMEKEYDIAIAYAGPMDFISYFVLNKIKAREKFQWIHFDVTKIGFDRRFVSRVYSQYNKVFVVSEKAKCLLESSLPQLIGKAAVFPNVIPIEKIREQAKSGAGFTNAYQGIKILTVGRLAKEKGQDLCIKVLAKLVEEGHDVKWYCVGEGQSRCFYEHLIDKYNLQDRFILLGADSNPYPYIAQCDVYVQPSRHEGYCITLAEARLLHKPIVTTDFTGAREQIRDGETGLIVAINETAIYNGVKKILHNKNLREQFSANLLKETIDHPSVIDKHFARSV